MKEREYREGAKPPKGKAGIISWQVVQWAVKIAPRLKRPHSQWRCFSAIELCVEAQSNGKGWLRPMSINFLHSVPESKPKTEEWQTGFSDVVGEPTDEVWEIMRRNSETIEQMITNRVRDSR